MTTPTEGQRPKIVVVDDDETIRDSLQLVFGDRYDVVTCASPAEGIAVMDSAVHLVILDIRLNGRDGFWTYQAIRERFKDTPMLFYSAYQDVMDPYEVMNEYRPFAFLLKDGDLPRLERVVEEAVGHYAEKLERERYVASVEQLSSVGTLAASMAHEINNPLTYILGNLEHARELLEPRKGQLADAVEAVDTSIQGVLRVAEIVDRLKDSARPRPATSSRANIRMTVEQAVRSVENEVRNRARMRLECSDRDFVACEPGALSQVLVNLLLNAAQALPIGRSREHEIAVRSWWDEAGDEVVLRVSDSGPGVPEAIRGRIFEPFVTSRTTEGGMGIGLFIAHNIVTSAEGRISLVDDPASRGAVFEIRLPAADLDEGDEPAPAGLAEASSDRLAILVIDDERLVGDAIVRMLAEHDAEWFESAEAGLERIASGPIDLVFCDVMMPDLTGRDVYERLRERGLGEERRIVFMTGGVLAHDLRRFLDRVDIPVLKKPLTQRDLLDVIEELRRGG